MRLFLFGLLLTLSEARRRFSSDKIFEKLNAEFPVNTILAKYNTSIDYVTNIIKEARKTSIGTRSFETLADSAQAVMAILVGVGPPPPPFPSYDEILEKYVWNTWGRWSSCSETCGMGTRTRTRTCNRSTRVCEKFLETKASETRRCRDQPCSWWTSWNSWTSCSKTCGEGISVRRRQCSGSNCLGKAMDNRKCSNAPCHSGQRNSDWEEWSSCQSCSYAARQMRKRACAFKTPTCPSPPIESRSCFQSAQCKSARAITQAPSPSPTLRTKRQRATTTPSTSVRSSGWSEWSTCNAGCGHLGFRTRTRPCTWKPKNCHKFKSKATERCFRLYARELKEETKLNYRNNKFFVPVFTANSTKYLHTTDKLSSEIIKAIEDVKKEFGIDLDVNIFESNCQPDLVISKTLSLWQNRSQAPPVGLVGFSCDAEHHTVAQLASQWELPLIAPGMRRILGEKDSPRRKKASTTIRTGLHSDVLARFLKDLLDDQIFNDTYDPINPFGVSLLSLAESKHGYPKSSENDGDCGAYMAQLHSKLSKEKKKYSPVSIIAENEEEFCDKQDQIVAEIMARSRTVIFCMEPHLFRTALQKITESPRYKLEHDKKWNFIYLDLYRQVNWDSCYLWSGNSEEKQLCPEPAAKNAYSTNIWTERLNDTLKAKPFPSEDLLTGIWQTSVVSVPQLGLPRLVGPIGECRNQPPESSCAENPFQYWYYEAIFSLGAAINHTIQRGGDPYNGTHLLDFFRNGSVEIRKQIGWFPDQTEQVKKYFNDLMELDVTFSVSQFFSPTLLSPTNAREVPKCFKNRDIDNEWIFDSEEGKRCVEEKDCEMTCGIAVVSTGFILFGTVKLASYIQKRFRCIANPNEPPFEVNEEVEKDVDSFINRRITDKTVGTPIGGYLRASLFSMNGQSGPQLRKRYTDLVVFKETVVAIKDLGPQFALLRLMKQEKEELRKMMVLNHRNVAVFHGLLYENEHGYFLQEYGAHGSLKDILSSKIQLTWEMKKSLVIDLIEGLAYIHRSQLRYHGFLNTTSCLVTGRLAVKVGNYGVQRLRQQARIFRKDEDYLCRLQLWQAPEILNNPSETDVPTLQRADVYSFGIIAHEVIYGKGCFWLGPETPNPNIETLVENVRNNFLDVNGNSPRPFIPIDQSEHIRLCNIQPSSPNQLKSSVDMANIMVACWSQNPIQRPELERLRKTMSSGPRKDMVDDLATRLQDYTTKLDQMVDQKTRKIAEEKMKSEELCYNLLPKSVAEDLSDGKGYEPVEFKAVTIYQSDIQGFTKIGTQSKPIQIMTMLRLIYEIFDRIISTVDAYKVETIGDAYVAVSAPRHKNAFSSLNQREIDKFQIPHLPHEKLMIRIGLHSGPVVSGVVGNVMPRWCLFGRTRELTDIMESCGSSDSIHVSEQTAEFLRRDPKINWSVGLRERPREDFPPNMEKIEGEIDRTFWLVKHGIPRTGRKSQLGAFMPDTYSRLTRNSSSSLCGSRSTRRSSVPLSIHSTNSIGSFIHPYVSKSSSSELVKSNSTASVGTLTEDLEQKWKIGNLNSQGRRSTIYLEPSKKERTRETYNEPVRANPRNYGRLSRRFSALM
ncbi:Oidioi.mRNA.OKI2018_I69.XSR.g15855.t1.cds [Oikopleura dioica]|uniref:guanylate cyclase n=1 Tax=Oikopleura dioica TaxID=34765 RepID=A0ABN7SI65_OIKDI|nr:Oidioi.mRNA.OKI2018_I69.XSR.g15855.t1.cds [Oikopleura dioica]